MGTSATKLRRGYRPVLSEEEVAAVLTGLRLLQKALEDNGEPPFEVRDIYDNAGAIEGLSIEQIEALCERVNRS